MDERQHFVVAYNERQDDTYVMCRGVGLPLLVVEEIGARWVGKYPEDLVMLVSY